MICCATDFEIFGNLRISKFWKFEIFRNSKIFKIWDFGSSKCFEIFYFLNTKNDFLYLLPSQTPPRRELYSSKVYPVQFSDQTKHFKNRWFFGFFKIFTTRLAPRVTRSTSLLLALRSSRRPRRPPGGAWAPPDDQTQCLISPQCPRNIPGPSSGPEGRLGYPQVPLRLQDKKNTC